MSTLIELIRSNQVRYPHALESQFARILNKIITLWDRPELESYFAELMIDNRGGTRRGFPSEVASDIFALQMAYANRHIKIDTDIWGGVEDVKRREIESFGFDLSHDGFINAIESGNERASQLFLSCNVDIEEMDEREWTPLMIASTSGHDKLVSTLIAHGAKMDVTDRNGYSPLHWAAFNGHLATAKVLIDHGADVNAKSAFGWTPLIQAATRGHEKIADLLLSRGASVNDITQDRWTALLKAAANGRDRIVITLLDYGANPAVQYMDGSTALMLAAKHKHDGVVLALAERRSKK